MLKHKALHSHTW